MTLFHEQRGTSLTENYFCCVLTESKEDRDLSKLETLVWDPNNPLAEKQADQFLVISR